jgi:hypothetical protein
MEPIACPQCGIPGSGRFCTDCGAPLANAKCLSCDQPLVAGARFCNHCGAPAGAAAGSTARSALPWIVPGVAVIAVVAFLIGQRVTGGGAATATDASPDGAAAPTVMRAPDISSMSPEERANRLLKLVIRLGGEGKADSVKFFAPMALQAYEMIGPPDMAARYDEGTIGIISGAEEFARAKADTILASNRNNLLGLVLAMRAAGMRQDMKARHDYQVRLVAAAPSERAKGLKEYEEHKADIDAALKPGGPGNP